MAIIPKTNIELDRVKELLRYDRDTGEFTWVKNNNPKCRQLAGCKRKDGYWQIYLDGKYFQMHRLAWFYEYGVWPKYHIDHIDGNPSNNAISNLRDAPRNINAQNKRTAPSSARTTKVLGVYQLKSGRFQAQIKKDKVWYNCGTHDTVEQAHAAYVDMKRKLHPGNML